MPNFTHLHVHSEYSLLDGLSQIKKLITKTKEFGQEAIALTDHGVMYGAIDFYKKATKENIKPIIGCEMYVAEKSRLDKVRGDAYHLLLLAVNLEGYQNLMKLSTLAHLEGFYYKPRVDKETLLKHHKGLVVTSGCPAGRVQKYLTDGDFKKAKSELQELEQIFGSEQTFIELQRHHFDKYSQDAAVPKDIKAKLKDMFDQEVKNNQDLVKLSRELGLPIIATNDVHYVDKDDARAQDAIVCVQTGKIISETNRLRYIDTPDFYLKSPSEMEKDFKDLPESISNTQKIVDQVDIDISLGRWCFPKIDLPKGKTAGQALKEMAYQGAKEKFKKITPEIKKRMDYELKVIEEKGYSAYFLLYADLVEYCNNAGIYTNTRGSAAGSFVSYCCGITTVDPLRFNLPFERFLNPFRPSPPDIDLDVSDDRRDEVFTYLKNKYGEEKFAQICTFGTMKAKAAIRDIGRVLGMPYSDVDKVAKLVPLGSQGFPMTIKKALETTPELSQIERTDPQVKDLLDLSKKVEGNTRHISVHACALVIAPEDLTNFTPLQFEPGGNQKIITQYEMHACEDVGLIKLDVLGIRNLSILANAVKLVKILHKEDVDIHKIPLDDPKTFEILCNGETFGIFQLASSGMTKYLMELKPEKIDDIMAMVALYRPGPMASIPEYIKRKHNPKLIKYFDPRMEEFLSASYGIITYQDDVLYIALNLADYNWEEVDKFRKAIGKKIPEEMEKQHAKFVDGCIKGGMTKNRAEDLFSQIETFAAYGFNKCVTGDTIVWVNGEPVKIDDLIKTHVSLNNKTFSLSANQKITSQVVKQVKPNGKKKTFALKTRSGRSITTTGNHPFLTFSGWKNLENLVAGDRVAIARTIPETNNEDLKPYQAAILGYLISDGNLCHPHGIYFYNASESIIDDYKKLLNQFENIQPTLNRDKSAVSVYSKRINQSKPNSVVQFIDKLGLRHKKATEKFIPPKVFGSSNKLISIFLAKLFMGDGCFDVKSLLVYYSTSSAQLASDLQTLLLKLGISSQKYTKKIKTKTGTKTGYTLNISHQNNLNLLYKHLNQHLVGDKKLQLKKIVDHPQVKHSNQPQQLKVSSLDSLPLEIMDLVRQDMARKKITINKMCETLNISPRVFSKDKRKRGFTKELITLINTKLKSKEIAKHLESDIYWDEIKEIKSNGIKQTYDLSIKNTHNFLANDFIVHNSHAASYGIVAYWTAYVKAHHPVEYMTALMSAEATHTDKLIEAINECEVLGIKVLPPDINESLTDFTVVDIKKDQALFEGRAKDNGKAIRFGLNAVKNVGGAALEFILKARKDNFFSSFSDFLNRVSPQKVNKKVVESLIKVGAFDQFGSRTALLAYLPQARDAAVKLQKERISGQTSLFGSAEKGIKDLKDNLPNIEDAPLAEILKNEKEILGVYLTGHPIKALSAKISARLSHKLNQLDKSMKGQSVSVAGIVASLRLVNTRKNNSRMAFAALEDELGRVNIVIFPQLFKETSDLWQEDKPVFVTGRLDNKDDELSLIVEEVEELNTEFLSNQPEVIEIPRGTDKKIMMEISEILKQNPGDHSVDIVIKNGEADKRISLPYKINLSDKVRKKIASLL
jgi:DNA polymerase III subunit alpha